MKFVAIILVQRFCVPFFCLIGFLLTVLVLDLCPLPGQLKPASQNRFSVAENIDYLCLIFRVISGKFSLKLLVSNFVFLTTKIGFEKVSTEKKTFFQVFLFLHGFERGCGYIGLRLYRYHCQDFFFEDDK